MTGFKPGGERLHGVGEPPVDRAHRSPRARRCSPTVTEVFPFNDALKSFEHVMTGHARGKVMLDMTQ